jgi:hypothetical protein
VAKLVGYDPLMGWIFLDNHLYNIKSPAYEDGSKIENETYGITELQSYHHIMLSSSD